MDDVVDNDVANVADVDDVDVNDDVEDAVDERIDGEKDADIRAKG